MKYNGVILKKFSVMDDEIARLKALGEVTTTGWITTISGMK